MGKWISGEPAARSIVKPPGTRCGSGGSAARRMVSAQSEAGIRLFVIMERPHCNLEAMESASGSRRFGRRAALLAALGAAAVAALAAPYGVRFCRETYAIHQLRSADDDTVLNGIRSLLQLEWKHGEKQMFERAVPALRRVADGEGTSAKAATLALARILPKIGRASCREREWM